VVNFNGISTYAELASGAEQMTFKCNHPGHTVCVDMVPVARAMYFGKGDSFSPEGVSVSGAFDG
jgi:hypothetical protein